MNNFLKMILMFRESQFTDDGYWRSEWFLCLRIECRRAVS